MSLFSNSNNMELLAPAGDWDSLLAAIAAGADAVYLGGKSFNARQNAANFDIKQLQEAADLLHLHQRRLYVTVNTLIFESELEEALKYLGKLYNIGADAVIIQDLGLIRLARKYLPDLELHASTQMTVGNREGAAFLKKLGLKRIVLARELTKAEVEAVALLPGIEVEVFVHGALCVCYSGQCLMSSMIGGRSGNRGRCAQPCRMEYRLGQTGGGFIPTKGSYLLSPKDLALITEIPALYRAGVKSLKIEGRMKRPEYVYQVVKAYRRALERFQENPAAYEVDPQEIRKLEQSFNRGFTSGYFGGNRNAELMSFSRPNNRGVFLGRIVAGNGPEGYVNLKLEASLEVGDEVEVWISQGGRSAGPVRGLISKGRPVNKAEAGETVKIAIGGRFHPGDRVFKVFSIENERQIKEVLDMENPDLKVSCSAEIRGELGEVLTVVFHDSQGNQGAAATETRLQQARNRPLTSEILKEQLGRLGNTPYRLTEVKTELPDNVMIPLSDLNQARRRAIEGLTIAKLGSYKRKPVVLGDPVLFPKNQKGENGRGRCVLSVWAPDLAGVSAAAAAGADLIYAGGDELTGFHWTKQLLESAIEEAHNHGAHLVIGLPRIQREGQRRQWLPYLENVRRLQPDGIILSDLGSLQLLEVDEELGLFLNYTFNFFNSHALKSIENPLVKQITLSPELTLEQIEEISAHNRDTRLECLVHGPLELMVSEYCPLNSILSDRKGECQGFCRKDRYFLRDRLDLDFPIFADQFCRMHLLNSKDLCLYGDLPKLTRAGVKAFRLELKTYPTADIGLIVQRYRMALDLIFAGQEVVNAETVIEEFKRLSGRGITKGHYFRGVE